jgi:hypothetical protein
MANETKRLSGAQVDGRAGYVNGSGTTFATPKTAKRIAAWEKKMRKLGYRFPDDAAEATEAQS